LIVTPPTGAQRLSAAPSPQLAGCTPTAMELVADTIGNGTSVPVSFPRVLNVTVADNCGERVDDATVVGIAEGAYIQMQGLGAGQYVGTWVPEQQSGAGVSFTVLHPTLPQLTRTFQVSVALAPEGIQLPVLQTDGVVEAAGLTPRRPLAPGGAILLTGSRFTTQQAAATQAPLSRELGGVRVQIGTVAAPLHFVSPGQIAAQMPVEAQPGSSVSVSVRANGRVAAPQTYHVASAMPGIYAFAGGTALVLDSQSRLITQQNPARGGDLIQIYATGLGATNPPVASGEAAPASSTVTNPVTVTIGGVPASVLYQGLAPGFVALYRVDAIVPSGISAGMAVPIVITQNGISSNTELPASIPIGQ